MSRAAFKINRVTISGDTITMPRGEYERLIARAAHAEIPPLPATDAEGNYPAVEFMRASIARALIRRRAAAGLSQQALAALAHVRQETISRIESGKHTATVTVMEKLERALGAAQRKIRRAKPPRRRRS